VFGRGRHRGKLLLSGPVGPGPRRALLRLPERAICRAPAGASVIVLGTRGVVCPELIRGPALAPRTESLAGRDVCGPAPRDLLALEPAQLVERSAATSHERGPAVGLRARVRTQLGPQRLDPILCHRSPLM
jgi:hypothetical protein